MRTLGLVGLMLVVAVVLGGSLGLLFGLADEPGPVGAVIAATGLGGLLFVSTLETSSHATWVADASAESVRFFQRLRIGVVVGTVACAGLVVAAVLVVRAPIWVAALLVALGVAATTAARPLGVRLRMRDERDSARSPAGDGPGADLERRALRRIALTFVVTLALATIGFLVLELTIDGGLGGLGPVLLVAAGFAFVAGGFAGTIAMLPANRRMRAIAAGDLARSRRLARAVLRRRPTPVDDDERAIAVEYASAVSSSIATQGLSTGLLCGGLALMQIPGILDRPDDSVLQTILAVWLAGIAIAVIPLAVVQRRRAQRYVTAHATWIA